MNNSKKMTTSDCLNKLISIAIEDGTITYLDIHRLVEARGSNAEFIAIDVLSMVYERRKDLKKLEYMQSVYRDAKNNNIDE